MNLGLSNTAFEAFISGSRIPGWIRYQSPGSEVKVELPLNSIRSNLRGFALSFVFPPRSCGVAIFGVEFSIFEAELWNNSLGFLEGYLHLNRGFESDHMCLFYVQLPPFLLIPLLLNSCQPLMSMTVSFKIESFDGPIEVKGCGVGLVYGNEYWNHNNPPMIHFNSISTASPDNAIVALEEIHKEELTDVKDPEADASDYDIADEDNLPLQLPAMAITLNQRCNHTNA